MFHLASLARTSSLCQIEWKSDFGAGNVNPAMFPFQTSIISAKAVYTRCGLGSLTRHAGDFTSNAYCGASNRRVAEANAICDMVQ